VLRLYDCDASERVVGTFVKGGAKEWERFTRVLLRRGLPVNCVYVGDETEDWGAYKVLIVPHLCVMTPATTDPLRRYVEGGGTLLLTARSGSKDVNNHVVTSPAQGLLARLVE
jgi:beta-galactosidase